ncbi:MAG: alpha-E domain-containing protein [Cyclobacteriaceae bacterium]|nr:alpha-E domain-containing protein [Cyclobacteriaceae bacterium]
MLSRVADAVFWMARYMERTDNVLRMLRTNYIASQDEIQNFNWQLWVDGLSANPELTVKVSNYREALRYLVLDKENDSSALTNIVRARENARSVQDYITKEVWQCMNDYYHLIHSRNTEQLLIENDPVTAIESLLRESVLFYGTVDITMSRGEGYTFLNLGKYLERSLRTLDLLELKMLEMEAGGHEGMHWKYLLYSLSGYEFHTKRYKNALVSPDVLDQVFLNTLFPHSVLYSLLQAERYFKRLDSISLPDHFKEMNFLLGKSISNLKYGVDPSASAGQVRSEIIKIRAEIKTLAQKLAIFYFGYS